MNEDVKQGKKPRKRSDLRSREAALEAELKSVRARIREEARREEELRRKEIANLFAGSELGEFDIELIKSTMPEIVALLRSKLSKPLPEIAEAVTT